jgi:phage-related holin
MHGSRRGDDALVRRLFAFAMVVIALTINTTVSSSSAANTAFSCQYSSTLSCGGM